MRYFDKTLIANSPRHAECWAALSASREYVINASKAMAAQTGNSAAIIPRDAFQEMDAVTTRVLRNDEGRAYMIDLLALAKTVSIGKSVQLYRIAGDSGSVVRSMSGQTPVPMDNTAYTYDGAIVPIFQSSYYRNWREWAALQSEGFDAIVDDAANHAAAISQNMAQYTLDGDATIQHEGRAGAGIRTNPNSKSINLGTAAGGANIDLTATGVSSDAIEAFINGAFGAVLDANHIAAPVNLYISPEIARNWDRPYSLAAGLKGGSLSDQIAANRRINKVSVTYELTGNQFFAFVPNAQYIQPLVGMPVGTTALVRHNPTDNYSFLMMGAMGLQIKKDANGRAGVFYSVIVNS